MKSNCAKWPFGFDLKENVTELGVDSFFLLDFLPVFSAKQRARRRAPPGQICVIGQNIGTFRNCRVKFFFRIFY